MTAVATETPRRAYRRTPPGGKHLVLNEFQADVVLNAVRNEIARVRQDRGTPESLKILAIRELTSVIDQLGEPPPSAARTEE